MKVQEAEAAEKRVEQEENREFEKEREEAQDEDKDFGQMKTELKADAAKASGQDEPLSKLFVDRELLAINERIHHLSERMEEISERLHNLAGLVEHLPSKVVQLELNTAEMKRALQNLGARPGKAMSSTTGPFWSVQVAAYNTKAGAEQAWSNLLARYSLAELNNARVQYVPSKPLKSGKTLTLVVLNEYASYNDAFIACSELKESGVDCVPVRVDS